jgi:hypothetical protein
VRTRYVNIDYDREIGIVAEITEHGRKRILGVARLIIDPAHRDEAEFALVVTDEWQRQGLGSEFLDYLIGWIANSRILLILLYRPEYSHAWTSRSYYTQIGVDQLTLGLSAELVHSILAGGDVAPEIRDLILKRTAGNPLFMEEFTHSLLENGSIQRKDHKYILTRKASDIPVPDTIQAIIAARMDRREDNLKRTMQVASVIGRDFAYRILQTITGTKEELKSHLVNLQGLEFIYEKSLFPELEYIFKHALTHQVVYGTMLQERKKLLKSKATEFRRPFFYVNMVGGQDELVFDGESLAVDSRGELVGIGKRFEEDLVVVDLNTEDNRAQAVSPQPYDRDDAIFNALILDHKVEDQMRGYQGPMHRTHLENEILTS